MSTDISSIESLPTSNQVEALLDYLAELQALEEFGAPFRNT